MVKLDNTVNFFNEILQLEKFSGDVSNNGLQVQGKDEINKILFAVDACQEVFETAERENADLIFVHHGISWGGGMKRWIGMDAKRFGTLFRNGISLYAAHLPLDANPLYGNNACLAEIAGITDLEPFFEYDGVKIGFSGSFTEKCSIRQIADKFSEILEIDPILRGDKNKIVNKAAIVSGGGGIDSVFAAKTAGCDLLITGEMEHIMHHPAAELGVAIIALGHYASETAGVLAMQKLTGEKLGIETVFAEVPTGL